jgi:hypothetical protein
MKWEEIEPTRESERLSSYKAANTCSKQIIFGIHCHLMYISVSVKQLGAWGQNNDRFLTLGRRTFTITDSSLRVYSAGKKQLRS